MENKSGLAKFSPTQIGCGSVVLTWLILILIMTLLTITGARVSFDLESTVGNIACFVAPIIGLIAFFWARNR